MIERDAKDEEGAVSLYKATIALAEKEGDITTAEIFRNILEAEEEHHDTFTSLLEEI